MRFSYRFISLDLDAGADCRDPFSLPLLTNLPSYNTQLAITSSSYLVFSFIVAYTAMLATQQRLIYARVRQMAFLDPVVHACRTCAGAEPGAQRHEAGRRLFSAHS
ncbi:hypothetical protein LNP74_19460 [Klebsiella pneumoniae subsp. pneumoniae]|nr:hypothetical protein [Klebsiella pneumoniae subsp. pneumoniae]